MLLAWPESKTSSPVGLQFVALFNLWNYASIVLMNSYSVWQVSGHEHGSTKLSMW